MKHKTEEFGKRGSLEQGQGEETGTGPGRRMHLEACGGGQVCADWEVMVTFLNIWFY